jgi:hypothetical protein
MGPCVAPRIIRVLLIVRANHNPGRDSIGSLPGALLEREHRSADVDVTRVIRRECNGIHEVALVGTTGATDMASPRLSVGVVLV